MTDPINNTNDEILIKYIEPLERELLLDENGNITGIITSMKMKREEFERAYGTTK